MKIVPESHLDHNLTKEQIDFVASFELKPTSEEPVVIRTVTLPAEIAPVLCALHGPIMGDEPIPEDETRLVNRGKRTWYSRMCEREPRPVNTVTIIAGPHGDEPCVLYTAYPGPPAPQEPGDPACKDIEASKAFWRQHALGA